MAQRTRVELTDDLDGGEADETATFSLDGTTYEIDLSAGNAEKFREQLAPYVNAARRITGRTVRGAGVKRRSNSGAITAIRTWARENGHDVSDRGRIAKGIVEAYEAAH